MKAHQVRNADDIVSFRGFCLADVAALNHDDTVRRCFRLYRCQSGFLAERIDDPDSINARYWAAECSDELEVYQFFGNEPLANYLYGRLQLEVPGLSCRC